MKKNVCILGAAALVMFAACQKEEAVTSSKVELKASVEQQVDPSGTKSTLDGTTVKWVAGDVIKVYNAEGTASTDLTATSGGTSTSFTGDDLSSGSPAAAIYPASIASGYDGTNISFTLPATQTYAENSFGQDANVAVGVVSGTNVSFKNVCGVLKLQLKGNYKVSKIELKGNNNEKLSGSYSVNASTYTMSCGTAENDAEKLITLNCPAEGVQLSATTASSFYFVIPVGAFQANGFTAKVYEKDNGTSYTYTELCTTSNNSISRSIVKKMPESIILPPAYQKVSYIESTGEQSISTGVRVSEGLTTIFESGSTITSTTEENGDVLLFKGKTGRVGSVIFKDDDETIHYYIPCYLKSDATKIGLFDLSWNGKNLYNHDAGYRIGFYANNFSGQAYITGFGSIQSSGNFMTTLIPVEAGETYTLSIKSTEQKAAQGIKGIGAAFFDSDRYMTSGRIGMKTIFPVQLIAPDDAVSVAIWWQHDGITDSDDLIKLYPQLEAGTIGTYYQSFSPFIANSGTGDFSKGSDVNN